jgi:hypothetical protein
MLKRILFTTVLVAGLLGARSRAGESFRHDVPLNIHEVAGVARRGDIVSTGVPLPCGALMKPEGVAVYGPSGRAVPAQFRVLERWREKIGKRDDKSIKWLLVTFLADVPAGGKVTYRLRAGKNPAPAKPVKIEEAGGGYEIGGLEFKKDLSAPFVPRLTDPQGKLVPFNDLKWSVWEKGPVRACLKAESNSAKHRYGLIMWTYAYAGGNADTTNRWDVTVVLKNTPHKLIGPLYFKEFSLSWSPGALKGAKDFLLGGAWGKVESGSLAGKSAYLYQSGDGTDSWATLSRRLRDWRTGKYRKANDWAHAYVLSYNKVKGKGRPEFRGYKVFNGEEELAAGNGAQGWAGLSSGAGGGLVLVRDFLRQYPKSVEVAEGRLTAGLWPKYWKAHGGAHWLDDCQRKAHDVSFRLTAGKATAKAGEAAAKAFDHPLVIHCGTDWYRRTGVNGFIARRFKAGKPGVVRKLYFTGSNWVTYGGDLSDRIRRRYHQRPMGSFVRGGSPHSAKSLYAAMRHSSGMTPLWPDDYRYPRDVGLLKTGYCAPPRPGGKTGRYRGGTSHHGYMAWNTQHFMCAEIYDGWRLFGDPLALDAVGDLSVYLQSFFDLRMKRKWGAGETRVDAMPMTVISHCYRILGDEQILANTRKFVRGHVWRIANKQRGYYIPNRNVKPKPGADKPFMLATLQEGLRQYWYLSGDEVAYDLMMGFTDFSVAEGWINEIHGFRYTIPMDLKISLSSLEWERKQKANRSKFRCWQMSRPLAWAYIYSGEKSYKRTLDGLVKAADGATVWKRYWIRNPDTSDWGHICDRARDQKRADTAPPEAIKDLKAEALGGGKVKLTWTTPDGAKIIRVKYAGKPMVKRIDFASGTNGKSNWWGANNVEGEPEPKPGRQSMTVTGVEPGRRVFAVRTFDAGWNRSKLSNQVVVEVR